MKKQTYDSPETFRAKNSGTSVLWIEERVQILFRLSVLFALVFLAAYQAKAATGELTFVETYKNRQNGITGLEGAEKPFVSPDGKNVYAVALKADSNNTGSVVAFERDPVDGTLTYLETEDRHPGINGPKHIIVSPDGKWVYVCTLKDQSVLTFQRNADGTLTFLDSYDLGRNMTYIGLTPDGENLYAVSSRHVERFTIDTTTGLPTWVERVKPTDSKAGDKLTVSDDGKFLYWGDINANRVYVFAIDESTGGLTELQVFNNGDNGSFINGVTDLKISPNGLFLYIASTRDDYLTVFNRDPSTGLITFSSQIPSLLFGSGDVRSLVISPDGSTLVCADQNNSIRSYTIDSTTGALTLFEEERDGVNGVDGLERCLGLHVSPDGKHIYTAARRDHAVTLFNLDTPGIIEEPPAEEKLFWVETAEVKNINKDGSGDINTLVSGLEIGYSIAVDQDGGKVYWADRVSNKISRSNVDGSDVEDIYVFNSSSRPFTIALDVAAGDIYFASPDTKTIKRGKMDGSAAPVVIYDSADASAAPNSSSNPGIRDVRGIALDVAAGMIYWTDRGTGDDRVVRGSMDGTMTPQLLYIQVSGSAQDIALDIDAGMLYWANSGRGQIERAKMDGSGDRITVYSGSHTGGWPTGLALDVAEGNIYWSANKDDTIRLGKMDGQTSPDSTPIVLVSGLNNPNDIELASVGGSGNSGGGDPVDEAPVITLLGDNPLQVECGTAYSDPGATASDDLDGDISGSIVVDASAVNTSVTGSYVVIYGVSDSGGNVAEQVTRTVEVVDTTAPVIALNGDASMTLECGIGSYQELGATATDACDPNVSVVIGGDTVNPNALGVYTVTYNAVDSSNNAAVQVTRTITVVDTTAPVIALNGNAAVILECGIDTYQELGAAAADSCDPNVAVIVGGDIVNPSALGVYTVTYDAVDASGNVAAQVVRTVTVVDTTAPVITLNGDAAMTLECSIDTYSEQGAIATDVCDPNVTVTIGGDAVDTTTLGVYTVTYDAVDASGNVAAQVVRTVTVVDTTAPVITLNGDAAMTLECSIDTYSEQGAIATDVCDPNVTVTIGGDAVDATTLGVYTVTYDAVDASGNIAAQVVRTVTVVDTTAPVITLLGDSLVVLECHIDTYAEDGASVFDACDGGVQVVVAGSVDVNSPGTYLITYDAVDGSENEAVQVVRTVVVEDTIAPVVAIIGSSDVVLLQHDVYVEEGATVADECDTYVTIVADNSAVDTSSIGVFTVTYDAVDASGNNAITQLRTVTVLPRFAALDALFGCADLKLEEDAIVDGTIGGMNSIQLHKESLVTGDVFNVLGDVQVHQDAQVGGVVDAGGKVTLHKESSAGSVVSGQQVDLKKNAQVSGDVVSASDVKLAKGASVGGVISENQSVTPMAEIQLPVLNLVAGGSDVRVSKNDSILLAPGVYQALQAKQNSTVELVSGHYSFSEFKVERGSVLQLDLTDGPVIVDVVGELNMEGVEMSVLNGGAQDVLFQVQGDQAKLGTDEDDDEVVGAYIGTYLVANGQLMLEPGVTLIGAGYARSVMVKEDGLVQPEPAIDLLVEAAAQWVGMTSCFLEIEDEESESDDGEEDDEDEEDSESVSKSEGDDKGKKSSKRKGKK